MPESAAWAEGQEDPEPEKTPTRRGSGDHKLVIQLQDHKAPGPRAAKKVQWIHLAEDGEYADHQVRARVRYPDVINQEFSSGDFPRVRAALRKVILEHNGWIDPDTDEVMEPASSDAFWESVSQEEILLMMKALGSERKKLLSSLLETQAD